MSTVAMSICWPLQINSASKSVLISLADNANDGGVCWPSVATIAERTCFGRTAVMNAIADLERLGLLSTRRRVGVHNVYRIELAEVRAMVENQSASRTSPDAGLVRLADSEAQNQSASRTGPVRQADTNRQEPPKEKQPPLLREAAAQPARADSLRDLTDADLPEGYRLVPVDEAAGRPRASRQRPEAASSATWAAYAESYQRAYGAAPLRNARVNGQLAQFVARVGAGEAPQIAAWFVGHPGAFYRTKGHSVGCLLADAEKLRTEWATGRVVTAAQARDRDRTASNPFAVMLARRQQEARHVG